MLKKYRLGESHHIMRKVDKVFELCNKLGISFRYSHAGHMMVDVDGKEESFYIEDVDSSLPIETIPHSVEYKITYEK